MKEKILVVDDERILRDHIEVILSLEGYQVTVAENGKEALGICGSVEPDLIVSDIKMPIMDGFTLLEEIRSREKGAAIPFLFLSAFSQAEALSKARRLAVDDYLFKPFEPQDLLDAVRVRLDRRHTVQVFDTREAHLQTVLLMANTIEARDPYTGEHVNRVREIAMLFGKALGWENTSLAVLEFGAILHDVGKIVVPTAMLNKKGKFTQEEWKIMREHPDVGAKMLRQVDHLKSAVPFVLYHHERWDGTGYPFGLKGEAIPLEGRVLALADVYDAVTSDRSYHKGMPKEKALKLIEGESGSHFDPFLADIFLELDLP